MYYEIGEFIPKILKNPFLWKDGEFWTALVIGISVGIWCHYDAEAIFHIRSHFGDLFVATNIMLGFMLIMLLFQAWAACSWSNDSKIKLVAEKIVDWLVWTAFTLLTLIGYILVLWAFAKPDLWSKYFLDISFGILGFLISYSGFQVVNHILIVRFLFQRRHRLYNTQNNG